MLIKRLTIGKVVLIIRLTIGKVVFDKDIQCNKGIRQLIIIRLIKVIIHSISTPI